MSKRRLRRYAIASAIPHLVVLTAVWTCSNVYGDPAVQSSNSSNFPKAQEIAGCENVFAASENLLSGGVPNGDEAFASLAAAGVKTIISVDGMKPDVDAAAKYGIRYVHLPIGYDGVPHQRVLEISRAIRDLSGKVYIHCHHGKHRSPAATAAVLVCTQGWSPENAVNYMKTAGTSPSYVGLYCDILNEEPATAKQLDDADHSFPSVAKTSDFVATMTAIEDRFDHLTAIETAGWKTPTENPDLVPTNEALQLLELYKEAIRLDAAKHRETDFTDWMRNSENAAAALEIALRKNDFASSSRAYMELKNACAGCHAAYRNVPKKR